MKAYNVYINGMKIGNVFEYNVFDALAVAVEIYGHFVEVMESK